MTKIEWADETINLVAGCQKISLGCDNCYAERMANRLAFNPSLPETARAAYLAAGNGIGRWSGRVVPIPGALDKLAKLAATKKPKRIFVQSMGDLFHEAVPWEVQRRAFEIASCYPRHTFILLTKRPENMARFIKDYSDWTDRQSRRAGWWRGGYSNVWLGVTAENQEQAEARIPVLLSIPAAVRFVSVEPMLSNIGLMYYLYTRLQTGDGRFPLRKLNWVICGAETGPGARYMDPQWARGLRDQCKAARVPFFMKKLSGGAPVPDDLAVHEFPSEDDGIPWERKQC